MFQLLTSEVSLFSNVSTTNVRDFSIRDRYEAHYGPRAKLVRNIRT